MRKALIAIIPLLCVLGCGQTDPTPTPSATAAPAPTEAKEQEIYKTLIDANIRNQAEADRRYHIPRNDEAASMTTPKDELKRLFDQSEAFEKDQKDKSEADICARYGITPETLQAIRVKGVHEGWPKSQLSEAQQKRLYGEWHNGLKQIDEQAEAKYPRPENYINDPPFEKRRKAFEDRLSARLQQRILKKYHITPEQLEGIDMKAIAHNW